MAPAADRSSAESRGRSPRRGVAVVALMLMLAASVPAGARAPATGPTFVVDDATPGRFDASTGWSASAWNPQRHGLGYHFARPGARDDYALFRIKTPVTGRYDVYAWWPSDRGYNAAARIRIETADGPRVVIADQRADGGRWTKLGTFRLAAGDEWIVAVSSRSSAPGFVVADAFRIDLAVSEAAPQEPPLRLGDRGPLVSVLQRRLAALAYLDRRGVSGRFDSSTWHGVVAFQGWQGLERDGIVGPMTRAALTAARRPQPWLRAPRALELDLRRQVLLLVLDGLAARAVHVSTAAPGYHTPTGTFRVYRRELRSWSYQYDVWLPYALYFHEGHVFHGYPSVPAYPASHGCVRVPTAEAPGVYDFARLGTLVSVR